MRRSTALFLCVLFVCATRLFAGEKAAPRFTKKPTVARADGKVKIEFAVDRETDVAVFIEDAEGKVLRHLVAGVLGGKNPPPPPLEPGLVQRIEWDGRADYGRPAGAGPFKVRVALGLGARYDRVMSSNRRNLICVNALGTGPDGTLYVQAFTKGAVWSGPQILAFNRDGSYQRMVMPYPSSLGKEQVKGITSFELEGRPVPLLNDARMGLYPNFRPVRATNVCVSGDGARLHVLCSDHRAGLRPSMSIFGADGSSPAGQLTSLIGAPGNRTVFAGFSCMAVSLDGKYAYLGGLQPEPYKPDVTPAVYRVKLPKRTHCEPFFGDQDQAGKDDSHLGGAPRGLAVDGNGRLFIADFASDRVVVVGEKDGKYVGEFATTKPDYVAVSSRTGAIYVSSHRGPVVEIVNYSLNSDFKGAREVGRIAARLSRTDCYSMAVDCSADPAVVWAGDRFGNLVRIEERGGKFGDPVKISGGLEGYGSLPESYMGVVVDRQRREIYTRNSTGGGLYYRFSEETGEREEIRVPGDSFGGGKGFQIVPGTDGNLYGLRWPYNFHKWDRRGKPTAWEHPVRPTEQDALFNSSKVTGDYPPKFDASVSFVPVSMVELPHTLGVRQSDGHLFAFTFLVRGRVSKCLHEYLPTGQRVTTDPIIWMTSDAIIGPKFDAAGNIYVAEVIKPKGWCPPELDEHFTRIGVKDLTGPATVAANMYGSIVKFSPRGGTFDLGDERELANPWDKHLGNRANPFEGELKLPEGLKTVEVEYFKGGQMRPAKVIGAEWIHPGIGHVGLFYCNCENVTFDVDEFGRVFFPDLNLFRVHVIDTAGNALTHFGGYGNAESMGPDSPVIDPKTGKLRSRKADDPKDMKSPFAEPEIALAWPLGIGVTDCYAYIGDSLNRRLLRVKLIYAVEETIEVK